MSFLDERRQFVRMPTTLQIEVRHELKQALGTVIDLSPGGCRLTCQTPFSKGQKITVRFPIEEGEPPLDVRGEIAWTLKPDPDRYVYQYGIRFKEHKKFEKLGPLFLDYLAFKRKMDAQRRGFPKKQE